MSKDKKRLTILVGAGAVIEASKQSSEIVTTASITNKLLSSNKIKPNSKALFGKIYYDLLCNNLKWSQDYTPNFEDIFHTLEILAGLYTEDFAAPEFKPIYKYFTTLKDDYKAFNPNVDYKKNNLTLSFAFSDLLETIVQSIESYSDLDVIPWYKDFFLELNKHYLLDIFSLNYDNWFEKIFKEYNDGFFESNNNSDFLAFNPQNALDTSKHDVNINHLHGQIDFTFIDPMIAKNDFDDDNFYTIYKLKNSNNKKLRNIEGNPEKTQSGEHLKQSTIITGKIKTEKVAIPPFDTYRVNLHRSLMQNPNLLIIGYGFADYYINNILKQFHKVHQDNKRVNIIDFISEDNWNKNIPTTNQFREEMFRTIYGIFLDQNVDSMRSKRFVSPQLFNNEVNHLYLRGFNNAATNNIKEIIQTYERC